MPLSKSTQVTRESATKPSELAITLAALPFKHHSEWAVNDEIRGRLKSLFGFEVSSQWLARKLATMASVDAPWLERQRCPWDHCWEYRVTQWGRNDIDNKLPRVQAWTP